MDACVGRWGKSKSGVVVIACGDDDSVLKVILREELIFAGNRLKLKVEVECGEDLLWTAIRHIAKKRDDADAGWQLKDYVFRAFGNVDDAVAFIVDPGDAAQAVIVAPEAVLAGHQQAQLREQLSDHSFEDPDSSVDCVLHDLTSFPKGLRMAERG